MYHGSSAARLSGAYLFPLFVISALRVLGGLRVAAQSARQIVAIVTQPAAMRVASRRGEACPLPVRGRFTVTEHRRNRDYGS